MELSNTRLAETDYYFDSYANMVSAQSEIKPGKTATDNSNADQYQRIIGGWQKISSNGAAHVQANSIPATDGGQSESVSISGTSAQSSAITTDTASIYSTVDCFMRHGSNPTALADDTDDFIPANNKLRISGITSGNKLAFITAGASGKVYITPGG